MTAFAGTESGIDAACQLFDGMLLKYGRVKAKPPEQALQVVRWMAEIGVRGGQRKPWSGHLRRALG